MSKSNAFETDLLELLFLNTNIANIGDATGLQGSSAAGNFYVSAHTASPGEAGDQTTSEAGWTSYARVAVPRNGSNWTVTGDTVDNDNNINFPKSTGGGNFTVTHLGVGTSVSGAGLLLYYPALTSSKTIEPNDTLVVEAGDLDISED